MASQSRSSDLSVTLKTDALKGVRVTVCAGGGIAAIELPRIIRELRRYGAQVRCMATENCLRFIGRESLEWASTQPVTTHPTGFADHISDDDAILVFPATADLIGKFAHGICSDGVTTLIQSALGQNIPVFLWPTMHDSMSQSPIVKQNLETLSKLKHVFSMAPRVEEGKQKAPEPETFVLDFCHSFNSWKNFGGNAPKVIVTYGGTRSLIDPVRCLTNLSTGELGRQLIKALYAGGIEVTALEGAVNAKSLPLSKVKTEKAPDFEKMRDFLAEIKPGVYEGIFHIAAVSDFAPEKKQPSKISSSDDTLKLTLVPTQKLIELPSLKGIPFQVACKLTSVSKNEGLKIASEMQQKYNLNLVLWNSISALESGSLEQEGVLIARRQNKIEQQIVNEKTQIAAAMTKEFVNHYSGKLK